MIEQSSKQRTCNTALKRLFDCCLNQRETFLRSR